MVWSTCTILHNKVVGKLKTVTVDVVKKNSMVLRWRLDCSDRVGIVTGYKVVYCPIDEHDECINGLQLEDQTSEEHATITNLEPWTTYKVNRLKVTTSIILECFANGFHLFSWKLFEAKTGKNSRLSKKLHLLAL